MDGINENEINGPGLLYASIRDIQTALRLGQTGEIEMELLITVLPTDVFEEIQEPLKEFYNGGRQETIDNLTQKYTEHYGHPSNNLTRICNREYEYEMLRLKKLTTQTALRQIIASLVLHKYIYQERKQKFDTGAMSLYKGEREEEE